MREGEGIQAAGGVRPAVLPGLVSGPRIEENRSRFQACGAPCPATAGAAAAVDALVTEFRLAKATHLSWAARSADGLCEARDDGGESGSGRCILESMQAVDARGCVVLVARWYGGRHLGGARFRIYRRLTLALLTDRDLF